MVLPVSERSWHCCSIAVFFYTDHTFSSSLVMLAISLLFMCYLYEHCIAI